MTANEITWNPGDYHESASCSDCAGPRARDPGQPRQSDGRSGRDPGRRHHGPRGGPLGGQHRDLRGGRAPRRRQVALPRQGRDQGGGQRQYGAGRGRRGPGPGRPGRAGPRDDRGRRHAEQGEARRQRDPGRQPGRGQGGGRSLTDAAVPLHRRRQCEGLARPDGQHHQRRQARRQQDRLPGIHGHARRRQVVRRGHPHGRRGLPQPQVAC